MPVHSPVPADAVCALIREVAAAEIMPRYGALPERERWRKRHGSVVTAADVATEAFLAARLPALLPDSVVVGEEMCADAPEILDKLRGDAPVWVVDPVDGTSNFANGSPDFAVMVALLVDRRAVAGWIYRPVPDAMYVAEDGAGAFRDGERLRIPRGHGDLSRLEGSLGGRLRERTDLPRRFARVTASRCIGVDYCALVDGGIHFAHYRGRWAWDHAAGTLLHTEAGGFNRCLDGTHYRPGRRVGDGILLAPDQRTWDALRAPIVDALGRKG